MSGILGSVGKIFGSLGHTGASGTPNWLKAALGGMAGMGEIGNILASHAATNELNRANAQEQMIANLTPQQLAAMIASGTQPLSQGFTESVGNKVQADLAERGLAQAPGIFATVESQALAPYELEQQRMAEQAILQKLGLPAEYFGMASRFLPQQTNLAPLLELLLRTYQGPSGSVASGADLPSVPNTQSVNDAIISAIGGGS